MLNIIRNNNPMAIRANSNNKWAGKVGESKGFEVFITPAHGIRAGMRLLKTAYFDKGHNTLEKIFLRYAPSADGNNPKSYAQRVFNNFNPSLKPASVTSIINLNNEATLKELASQIIEVECGNGIFNQYFNKEEIMNFAFDFYVQNKQTFEIVKNTASELYLKDLYPGRKQEVVGNLKKQTFTTPGVNETPEKKKIILFVLLAIALLVTINILRK
jgi:hypothetical protein